MDGLCGSTFYPSTLFYKNMFLYLFSLVSLLALSMGAQQVPLTNPTLSPFTPAFDKLVTQNLDRWHTPGLAIAIIRGNETSSKV